MSRVKLSSPAFLGRPDLQPCVAGATAEPANDRTFVFSLYTLIANLIAVGVLHTATLQHRRARIIRTLLVGDRVVFHTDLPVAFAVAGLVDVATLPRV